MFDFLTGLNAHQVDRVLKCPRDWNTVTKYEPALGIQASTYSVIDLFPELPTVMMGSSGPNHDRLTRAVKDGKAAISPKETFVYSKPILPARTRLDSWMNKQRGFFAFDGPVAIPTLHEFENLRTWDPSPWMSLTPAEIMSLRPGTRLAHGHTVITGLGLGHQLIEVSKRKRVKKITLVEISQALVDWLYPRIKPYLGDVPVDVIVGDANQVVPKLTADIALLDHFAGYGGNKHTARPITEFSFDIKKFWVWGGG